MLHCDPLPRLASFPRIGESLADPCPSSRLNIRRSINLHIPRSELISAGGVALHVLHTPGHSPGHVCYYAEMIDMLFCGDLILGAGVGCAPSVSCACVAAG